MSWNYWTRRGRNRFTWLLWRHPRSALAFCEFFETNHPIPGFPGTHKTEHLARLYRKSWLNWPSVSAWPSLFTYKAVILPRSPIKTHLLVREVREDSTMRIPYASFARFAWFGWRCRVSVWCLGRFPRCRESLAEQNSLKIFMSSLAGFD